MECFVGHGAFCLSSVVLQDNALVSAAVFAKWCGLGRKKKSDRGSVAPPVVAIDAFSIRSSDENGTPRVYEFSQFCLFNGTIYR